MTALRSLILSIDATAARTGAAQYSQAAQGIRGANASIRSSVAGVDASMKSAAGSISGVIAPMKGFIAISGAVLTVTKVVKTLTEFEDAITRVGATTGATGRDLQRYRDIARELGATTEFTAGQVANAEVQLAQAGLTLRQTIQTLPTVTDFATASSLSLGQAADITTKILAAYRLEASDAARVTDSIVVAANNATTSQAELARALVTSIPSAKGLGVEFEELVAVQAELARVGLRAEKGGRGLDAVIRALTRPTERAQRVLEEFGVSLEDINVRKNGLIGVIKNLKDAGLEVEQFAAIFDAFGGRAIPGLAEAVASIDLLRTKVENAQGATKRFADDVRDTLTGRLKEVASAFEELALQSGDSGLLGSLKGLAETLRDAFRTNGARLLARSVGDLFNALNSTIDLVADFSGFLSGFRGNAAGASQEAQRFGDNVSTLGPVFESLTSPLKTLSALTLLIKRGFLELRRAGQELQLFFLDPFFQSAFKLVANIDLRDFEADKFTLLRDLDRIEKEISSTIKEIAALDTGFGDAALLITGESGEGIRRIEDLRKRFKDFIDERKRLLEEAEADREKKRNERAGGTAVFPEDDERVRGQRSSIEVLRQEIAREAELANAAARGVDSYRDQEIAIEARNLLLESGVEITEDSTKATADLIRRYRELQEGNEEYLQVLEETRRTGEQFGQAFGGFLADVATDFDNAADAARRLVRAIQEIALQQVVIRPLGNLVGNVFAGLQGGAGNVVQSLFGGTGAPASASLAAGTSAASKSSSVTVNQTIQIGDSRNDSRGFKLSGRQIAEATGRTYAGAN